MTRTRVPADKIEELGRIIDDALSTRSGQVGIPVEELLANHAAAVDNDPRTKDREMRFRWDLYWFARNILPERVNEWADGIPDWNDLLDTHLDTALKRVLTHLGGMPARMSV